MLRTPTYPLLSLPLLAAGYVVLAPTAGWIPGLSLYDSQRVLEILFLLISAGFLLLSTKWRGQWTEELMVISRSAKLIMISILIIGVISSMNASVPRYGFLEIGHIGLLFVATISISRSIRIDADRMQRILSITLMAAAALYVIMAGVVYVGHLVGQLPLWGTDVWVPGFSHSRFFNQFQVWLIPLLIIPAITPGSRYWAVGMSAFTTTLMYTLLFASGGRGALIALIGGGLLVWFAAAKSGSRLLRLQVLFASIGAVLYWIMFKVLVDSSGTILDRSLMNTSGRWSMWVESSDLISMRPILGVGPMHFAQYDLERSAASFYGHPHNVLLQLSVEWGVIVTALVVVIVVAGVRLCLKQMRQLGRGGDTEALSKIAVLTSLMSGLTYSLVSGVFITPVSQIMAVIVIGWSMSLFPLSAPHNRSSSFGVTWRLVAPGLVIILLSMSAWGVVLDLPSLANRQTNYIESDHHPQTHESSLFRPRFWYHGMFGHDENDTTESITITKTVK